MTAQEDRDREARLSCPVDPPSLAPHLRISARPQNPQAIEDGYWDNPLEAVTKALEMALLRERDK